jgi:hypothetical protein
MKTSRFAPPGAGLLAALVLLLTPASSSHAATARATPQKKGQQALPSAHLRVLIDHTLPQLTSAVRNKNPANRTALTEAQADWTALAQTAPPAKQATYAAAANVVQMLIAAEDEHATAVANFHYSNNVHGAQDKQDSRISNGGQAPGTAFANNAKQNKENADFRKELLQKEEFMNKGAIAEWNARLAQIQTAVEQAYMAELVTEKQMVAAQKAAPTPAPPPASTQPPKPASTASQAYSPVGNWTAPKGQWTLNEEGSFTAANGGHGTWHWSDPGKRELTLTWPKLGDGKGEFSADGKSLEITMPKGAKVSLTR